MVSPSSFSIFAAIFDSDEAGPGERDVHDVNIIAQTKPFLREVNPAGGACLFWQLGVDLVSEIRPSREIIEPDREQPKRQAEPFLTADLHLSLHSDRSGDRARARARRPASIEPANTRE